MKVINNTRGQRVLINGRIYIYKNVVKNPFCSFFNNFFYIYIEGRSVKTETHLKPWCICFCLVLLSIIKNQLSPVFSR